MLRSVTRSALIALLTLLPPLAARAQQSNAPRPKAILIGSPNEDRRRLDQLFGTAPLAGSLIRSPSASWLGDTSTSGRQWGLVEPVIDATWNSQIPFSLDDGALWAGRGLSTRVTAGIEARFGLLHVLIAPEVGWVENRAFNLLPSGIPGRSDFASPFQSGPVSADVPTRFGSQSFASANPGQSAAWMSLGRVDAGFSTENQWWGPALQNALIMSDNAPGIPEAFVRTNRPWHTRAGDVEAKAILGELTESLYFDDDRTNDHRAISGGIVTFAPSIEPHLTLGAGRIVMSQASDVGAAAGHALDVLTRWSTARGTPPRDSVHAQGVDQLTSLFGRWVFPASGLEVYGEWARMLPPISLRDLFVAPQKTQGYTIGMQMAGRVMGRGPLRFQAEVTDLEQTPTSRAGDTLSFYTSRVVPQGFTQRGQVIGAPIGPGGSSQLLAIDYMPPTWDVGLFGERIRWNDDAYYRQLTGISFFSHDVSVLGGIRGTVKAMGSTIHAELSLTHRFNFMFQNLRGGFGPLSGNDVHNETLRIWWSPLER